MNKKWLLTIMFVVVGSLTLVGCTTDGTDTKTGDPDMEDKIEDTGEDIKESAEDAAEDVEKDIRDMNYEDIKLKPEEAFDKFMELHPEAKVSEFNLDKDLMEYEYEIEGYDSENKYEVEIDPETGEVKKNDMEELDLDDDDEKGEITKDHLAKVDSLIDKAKEEDASDSKLDEWNIEYDDGRVVIEIEIGSSEYSYDMDTEELIEKD